MDGPDSDDYELAGHSERLTDETRWQIESAARVILEKFGTLKDAEISRFDPGIQPMLIDLLKRRGLTEETPINKQAWLPLRNARFLPEYLRDEHSFAFVVVTESLRTALPAKYRISYGVGGEEGTKVPEGPEVWLPWDGRGTDVVVISRDPSTDKLTSSIFTEAQGRDVVLDLQDVLSDQY